MHHLNTIKLIAFCAGFTLASSVFAQALSPYAGQQTRAIKALSASEVRDLLDGNGMGLAKAAELNGYPGPMHVLELQRRLKLTAEQQTATQQLMAKHKDEVRQLGAQLVQAETELDAAFASRQLQPSELTQLTQRIGQLQAAVRASHLQTHLAQTALLQPEQIAHYNELRGYTQRSPSVYQN
jgi:Spy/CpxP family protein refolding chaperone